MDKNTREDLHSARSERNCTLLEDMRGESRVRYIQREQTRKENKQFCLRQKKQIQ